MSAELPQIRVFCSYAHEDERHLQRLRTGLKPLEFEGLIESWSDLELRPGDPWEKRIEEELDRADLVLFLVSDHCLASKFIWTRELRRALDRAEADATRVVPVLVEPTANWKRVFRRFHVVPKDGVAVTDPAWPTEDKAWENVLTSLGALIDELTGRSTNPRSAISRSAESPGASREAPGPTRYLQALERQTSFLGDRATPVELRGPLEGLGSEDQAAAPLPLDEVYTRPRVIGPVQASGDDATERRPTEGPGLDAGSHGRSVEIADVLHASPDAVLIGDPGSGKTTLLRFAARILARSIRTGDPTPAHRELGIDAASPEEVPFPILVRLTRFADFLLEHPDRSCPDDAPEHLLRYLDFELEGRDLGLPTGELRRRVGSGGCFLLLDGLDEAPGSLRPRVAAIVDELITTASTDPPNRHLITCRTRAYQGRGRLNTVPAYPLAPFGEDQVIEFIRGWSRAMVLAGHGGAGRGTEAKAKRYEEELLAAIRSHDDVGPMTENPLMLTMLALVYRNREELPRRRNELYDAVLHHLLESRQQQSPFPIPERRKALEALSLALFTDPEGVQRSLGLAEAGRALAPALGTSEADARAFLDAEARQSGLVVTRTEGQVEFWHPSFGEYLAALGLATGGDYWEVLAQNERLHDDRWNEVVLLLAGCLRRLGLREARAFIEKILATGTDQVSRARAVGLVGRILADVKPYGGDPSTGTGYALALDETLGIFEPPAEGEEVVEEAVRVKVGEALGQAGDPRLADPEGAWVAIPGGTFWMGAQKEDPDAPGYDWEAYEDESPVRRITVSPFVLGRFLVTVQEFRRFVEAGAGGYLDSRFWDPEGWDWRKHLEFVEPASWQDQLRHPNRPVTGVSWYEADAYCRWEGGRLPTEAEWELAARGEEGRPYPWGQEAPDDGRANFNSNVGKPTPVGIYPLGASPEGIHDLAGSVCEWCTDRFGADSPQHAEDQAAAASGASRVLRGGAFFFPPRLLRAPYRMDFHPESRFVGVGFRVCRVSSRGP